MDEHSVVVTKVQRRQVGFGLMVLTLLMSFFLSLAYLVRDRTRFSQCFESPDLGFVCDGGGPSGGAIGAWTSLLLMFGLALWLVTPRSFWRGLLTSDNADDGLIGSESAQ